jgi:glycosyltransferase involved in cell wall biosynthesis
VGLSTDAAVARGRSISLSVLVPVYNEQYLVQTALARLAVLKESESISHVEVIVVDDGSTDRTAEKLAEFESKQKESAESDSKFSWTFIRHTHNQGKGAAVRTALDRASGELSVLYDADLEYRAEDLDRLASVFLREQADAVYGSRFTGSEVRRVLLFRHELANKFLTFVCNLLSNLNLTDVWTCYKMVRTSLFQSIPLESNDFRIEPEITLKLAKRNARVFEIPISYSGRTYAEGKKIGLKDAFLAMWAVLRFAFSDDTCKADQYGSQILNRMSRAGRYNRWIADTIRPFCGEEVLEIGSGVGNIMRELTPRWRYVASDINHLYLSGLEGLCTDRPYLSVEYCDISNGETFPKNGPSFDTVICLNVIEHVENDRQALLNIKSVLRSDGRAIVLVPQGPGNFGTLDEVLGHHRRYTAEELERLATDCGFRVRQMLRFNRFGSVGWFLNGKLFRRRDFGLAQIWMLNLLTPLMRKLDQYMPIPPLSLIAVLEPKSSNIETPSRDRTVVAPRPESSSYAAPVSA